MTLTLKRAVVAVAFLVGFASTANAQNVTRLDIPYRFHACEQVLPAGAYEIRTDAASRVISLTALGGPACYTRVMTSYLTTPGSRTRVTFRLYGTVAFLARVQNAGDASGLELFRAPAEKEYAKLGRGREIALLGNIK